MLVHEEYGIGRYPASPAGIPVGDCPACEGTLVRAGGAVTCLDCRTSHGLPAGATVLAESCDDCGLPLVRVARGEPFEVCIDRGCEPLLGRVRETFDRAWDCPDCGSDLRVLRRGGLLAGCERFPDCEAGFGIPDGVIEGTCDCGLPVFETGNGRRCLNAACAEG